MHRKREVAEDQVTRNLVNTAMSSIPKDAGQYLLYADNYYASEFLSDDLAKNGFGFTFTARSNRSSSLFSLGNHKKLCGYNGIEKLACQAKETAVGEFVVALSFKDKGKSPTNFYSNIHANHVVNKKRKHNGSLVEDKLPIVAVDYSESMGNVDSYDSHMVRCKPKHRNMSWRRTAILAQLKTCVVNTWICWAYYNQGMKRPSLTLFIDELKDQLLQPFKLQIKQEKAAKAVLLQHKRKLSNRIAAQEYRTRKKTRQ